MYFNIQQNMVKAYPALVFFLLLVFVPQVVSAANLSISPAAGNYEVGDHFAIKVMVSSNNVLFNAVSAVVSFPSSMFSVVSVSKANSVLNFWVTEPIANSNVVKFEGVALGGFTGYTGTVVTINFRAIKAGTGTVSFQSGQILANDGEGTDITSSLIGATFSIKEATPKTEPTPTPTPQFKPLPTLEPSQPLPTLNAPEIFLGKKDGVLSILGTSQYSNTQVLMTFIARDGTKIFILGVSNNDGSFNLSIPNSLKRGTYNATAVMVKEDKTNSQTSNAIIVDVGNIFSDITREIQFVMFLLLLTILYLLLRIHLHFKTDKNIHTIIKKEVFEAKDIIHKSFDILREDVIDYDNQKLTPTEHRRMSEIRKDVDSAEKVINKEIDDIK